MLLIASMGDAAALSSDAQRCRKAIGSRTQKLSATALQAMQRCYLAALQAGTPGPENCLVPATADTQGKIAAAEALLHKSVGGSSDQCGAIAGPGDLSYPSVCPAPCGAIAIDSFTTLADCLVCQAEDWASDVARDQFGTLTPPVAAVDQACVAQIAKAGLRQFQKRLAAMVKCQKPIDSGRGAGDCRLPIFFDPSARVAKIEDGAGVQIAARCADTNVQSLDVCDPPAVTTAAAAAVCTTLASQQRSAAAFDVMYPFSPGAPLPVCSTPPAIATIAPIDELRFPADPTAPYSPLPGGRIWYVAITGNDSGAGTAGDPLRTVNQAVVSAVAGDVILVHEGIYYVQDPSENSAGIVLDKNDVTLANYPGETVVLRPAGSSYGLLVSGDRVVVDGFDIQYFAGGGIYFGRLASPQQQLVLKNLTVQGGTDGIRAVVAPSIPNPTSLIQGLLLSNVTIAGSKSTLVGFNCGEGPCDDVKMQNLLVTMGGGGAGNSGSDAIAMESGDNILVVGSRVTGASADGFDFKCTRVAIVNSIAANVARNGMKLWQGGDIVNSLIYNTGADAAVVFDGAGDYRLLNSVVAYHSVGASAYSMTVGYGNAGAITLEITNSIFYRNSGDANASATTSLNLRNSILFGSENGQEMSWDKPPPITVGEAADPIASLEAAGGGADNPGFVDPLFADPAGADWTLQSGSPGVDAGTGASAPFPSYDILCAPRVVGAAADLGAYESQ